MVGMFISIDGPNGSGKTTLTASLASCLENRGLNVLATREPSHSCLGEFIRSNVESLARLPLACAVAADRYMHLEEEIRPALEQGLVVVSDRYVESSLVLQAMDSVPLDVIWGLNQYAAIPDLSVNLIARSEILRRRLESRPKLTRFEESDRSAEELDLYVRAREFLTPRGYNFAVLDGDRCSIEINTKDVCERVFRLLQGTCSSQNGQSFGRTDSDCESGGSG